MIEIIEFFIYALAILVPLVAIWAAFMVYTGRWETKDGENPDGDYVLSCETCDHFPTILNKQAD